MADTYADIREYSRPLYCTLPLQTVCLVSRGFQTDIRFATVLTGKAREGEPGAPSQ